MCLYPKLIYNKKYTSNKKNGGVIPAVSDERAKWVPVGCGKCMECKKQKARNWKVRLLEETKADNTGKFVTLSFSNDSLKQLSKDIDLQGYELDNEICKKAIRKFLERWRKKTKKSVKHWFVTEIGEKNTERVHIHGIIYTNNVQMIHEKWQYGNVWIGDYVNQKTINYIVKYLHKTDFKHKEFNSKVFTSPGIGKNYLDRIDAKRNEYKGENTKDNYKCQNGAITALPIYYRNKIYTDEEREKLWMTKLDEKVRYVNGVKIDVSKGIEEYEKARKEAQRLNERLGYGNDEKNWDRINYENALRRAGQKIK